METIQVIRIEHPEDGYGMWNSTVIDIYEDFSPFLELKDRHCSFPGVRSDCIGWTWSHFCAYKTVDQVKEWITTEEIKLLLKEGFIIYLLEISDYILGQFQVAYTKESIVSSQDISSLFL